MHKGFDKELIVPDRVTLPPPAFGAKQQSAVHTFIFTNLKKVPRACFTHRIPVKIEVTYGLEPILQGYTKCPMTQI